MCTVCGCGEGETRVEGRPLGGHAHEHRHADGTVHSHSHEHGDGHGHHHGHEHHHHHEHVHRHADGTVHVHTHDHTAAHGHGAGHEHLHQHAHAHRHADGTVHSHPHDHTAEHGHGSGHDHAHEHPHTHEHRHADGTVHAHSHDHASEHGHGTAHEHEHRHDHEHRHADGTVHGHPHDHAGEHGHGGTHEHEHHSEHEDSTAAGNLHFGHGPAHAHAPGMTQERMIRIEQDILGKNNEYANANRERFQREGVLALNLVSSPGSGKTSLLTATIERLQGRVPVSVIEGDQQTSNDAERIRATGAPAVQVNTGKGCHLDAHMVGHALQHLELEGKSLLLIENVGNLVCPSAFDLGEAHKVVILSVTEGEDKPLKYPDMFHASNLMILNKIDLLPYVDFSVERCIEYARRINPKLDVLQVSARTGEGMDSWVAWLENALGHGVDTGDELEALRQRIAELEAQLDEARKRP